MKTTSSINRRTFLKTSAAAAVGAALLNTQSSFAEDSNEKTVRTATDQVTLGNTGIKLSRLGFGAGTNSGQVQRNLGHEEFNKVIRYAYERGITYYDTAESYQTHTWLREALQGIPREKLFIQTKIPGGGVKTADEALERVERYLKELGTDYIDSLLIHCQVAHDWDERVQPIMEGLEKAKEKKMIRVHGISSHSLPAIRRAIACDWCQTMLVRVNPLGHQTDSESEQWNAQSSPEFIPNLLYLLQKASAKGKGVIAMKLVGNGDFKNPADREKTMRFVMNIPDINAAVIGFKSTAEVDESIERMNNALKEARVD